jgi:hypothetical protein
MRTVVLTRAAARRALALGVTAAACVASVASLDTASPLVTYTGASPAVSVTLEDGDRQLHVHVDTGSGDTTTITVTVDLQMVWPGFGDTGFEDGGAVDQEYPVVEAVLSPGSTDAGVVTLERAFTSSPGAGTLSLTVTAPCEASNPLCTADLTLTLTRLSPAPSGPIAAEISAEASIVQGADDPPATIVVTVSP